MEIKVPQIGESIHEALIAAWQKEDGAPVATDDVLCELETDKINVELTAETGGILHIEVAAGQTVTIGTVIGRIQEQAGEAGEGANEQDIDQKPESSVASPQPAPAEADKTFAASPAAVRRAREKGLDLDTLSGTGRQGRITLEDVQSAGRPGPGQPDQETVPAPAPETSGGNDPSGRPVRREAMTPIRQRIAARLLEARQQTAMLTTFNLADMTRIKALRARHQEHFTRKHGVKLGLMSFFVKAVVEALRAFPVVNARIDGAEIVYPQYHDIGIAVGTERGLVVPVLRDAGQLTFGEIEQKIADLAQKAAERKLTMADLEGGTFSISNGGVYGSLLSTPLLNPPQSGILGMHAMIDQPVVRDGAIVIRPMMNLALSYDHRLIDGREAVGFLRLIKDYIEDPSGLFLEL